MIKNINSFNNVINLVSAILIVNNNILLVKNKISEEFGIWTLPCGHINKNEKPIFALVRELYEETGLVTHIKPKFEFILKVSNQNKTLYNTFYSISKFKGLLTNKNDPDKIIEEVKFVSIKESLELLFYKDVKFALEKWLLGDLSNVFLYEFR